jgi:hypothetical protein
MTANGEKNKIKPMMIVLLIKGYLKVKIIFALSEKS